MKTSTDIINQIKWEKYYNISSRYDWFLICHNEKLIDIFTNNENLKFTEPIIELDRCWFNNIQIPEYKFIKTIKPKIITKQNFQIENCGKIIFQKLN